MKHAGPCAALAVGLLLGACDYWVPPHQQYRMEHDGRLCTFDMERSEKRCDVVVSSGADPARRYTLACGKETEECGRTFECRCRRKSRLFEE